MITITCDKCNKKLDWRKHPAFAIFDPGAFQHTYSCGSSINNDDKDYNYIQRIIVKEKDGYRMLDLCDQCKSDILAYITIEHESKKLEDLMHDE